MKKQYAADTSALEKKLSRVMERLGVEKYQYDWSQSRNGSNCYVEMIYDGHVYRFENSTDKSKKAGRGLVYVSDLFAAVVYSLEGLARAVEQDIFTLDMLLSGVPSLPAASPLEPCFEVLGFSERPTDQQDVYAQYKKMAKQVHPDAGGSEEDFIKLTAAYHDCLATIGGE